MKTLSAILLCAVVAASCLCCDLIALIGMGPLEAGTAAPEFTLSNVDGERVSLSDFQGQIVLLNFWTST